MDPPELKKIMTLGLAGGKVKTGGLPLTYQAISGKTAKLTIL